MSITGSAVGRGDLPLGRFPDLGIVPGIRTHHARFRLDTNQKRKAGYDASFYREAAYDYRLHLLHVFL